MAEEGVYARIPIADLTVREAYEQVDDPSFWDETMPPVLLHYNLSLDDYERLSVYQHRLLVNYLTVRGLVDGDA